MYSKCTHNCLNMCAAVAADGRSAVAVRPQYLHVEFRSQDSRRRRTWTLLKSWRRQLHDLPILIFNEFVRYENGLFDSWFDEKTIL